jgi:hypothetical protein
MFRRWNYGLLGNPIKYKQLYPPAYDLGLVTVNVTMHYSMADLVQDERDVLAMAAVMPKASARKVPRDDFLHTDYLGSEDNKKLVTEYIIHAVSALEIS